MLGISCDNSRGQNAVVASFAKLDDGCIDLMLVRASPTAKASYLKAVRAGDDKVGLAVQPRKFGP